MLLKKGDIMNNYASALVLQKLVFDEIKFERKGLESKEELKFGLQVQIGKSEEQIYKVSLTLSGVKENEYDLKIGISGFFKIENTDDISNETKQELIRKNTVAILMPYLRSELSLLTAQPGMECVVLPAFNINKMLDDNAER